MTTVELRGKQSVVKLPDDIQNILASATCLYSKQQVDEALRPQSRHWPRLPALRPFCA